MSNFSVYTIITADQCFRKKKNKAGLAKLIIINLYYDNIYRTPVKLDHAA